MNIQHLIDSIKLRYTIKREYFTIGIPVVLAILLLIGAYVNGHTLAILDPSVSSVSSPSDEGKAKVYQEYINYMKAQNPDYEGGTAPTATRTAQTAAVPDLDHYMIFAALVAITPYSIDRYLQRREKKRNEEDFTQFLFKMSELMRAGIDPIKSVIELSRSEIGSLNKHISLAASAMVIGNSFEDGMRRVSKSLDNELISKYIDLIVQASNMGGSVHSLILKASEDMRAMILIDREMEGNLQQYVLIFYLGQMILIVTALVLSTQLFPNLVGTATGNLFGDLKSINFQQGFFHMLIINAILGGIIIGKITEGSMKDGLKHCIVLTIISYIACVILILPAGTVAHDTITTVSGDSQVGLVGMPLNKSIQFHLEDATGKPMAKVDVKFYINPSSGKLSAKSGKTDSQGNVIVKVTFGSKPGMYTITASAKSNQTVGSAYVWAVVPAPPSSGGD